MSETHPVERPISQFRTLFNALSDIPCGGFIGDRCSASDWQCGANAERQKTPGLWQPAQVQQRQLGRSLFECGTSGRRGSRVTDTRRSIYNSTASNAHVFKSARADKIAWRLSFYENTIVYLVKYELFIGVFFSSYSAVREMVAHSGCFFCR
jgi:hypothetical protein